MVLQQAEGQKLKEKKIRELKKGRLLTSNVRTIATTNIDIPKWWEKSSFSFLATKTQKIAAGATIRNMVNRRDLASGPKISLPWSKKVCIQNNQLWHYAIINYCEHERIKEKTLAMA